MTDVRQRWRLVLRRSPAERLTQREAGDRWAAALAGTGLPLATSDGDPLRPRFVFAAPLPVGMTGLAELVDLFLVERCPAHVVREGLVGAAPEGEAVVDLYDVWPGAPPLQGQVVAADYRVAIGGADGTALEPAALSGAVARLLAAGRLDRVHRRGDRMYDLRPFVADLRASVDPTGLWMRLRQDTERGTGRPEEVLGALGDDLGIELAMTAAVRERIWLAGEAQDEPA